MTELTPEDWRLLWAYQAGFEQAREAFEHYAGHIHQIKPLIGLDELSSLLRVKEREEAFDRVLDNPMEIQP